MVAFDACVRPSFLAAGLAAGLLSACGGNSSHQEAVVKTVTLMGAQETPAVTTAASGAGSISVNPGSGAVSGTITTFGITGIAAHIHEGPVGVISPVIVPMTQGPTGTWTVPAGSQISASQIESFKTGNLYVNVHSTANPTGEILAQIGTPPYFAPLTRAHETPA